MSGAERIAEASEGIGFVRDEIADWLAKAAAGGPAGAHVTRLARLREILDTTLDGVARRLAADAGQPLEVARAYALASTTDNRVLFCRRLFRWYALRFDQRGEPYLRACLAGADEVVWSTWARTFAAARAQPRPAPLCFVDNDPIPSAGRRQGFPAEMTPPSADDFFTGFVERSGGLPIPVIGLPPVVARRPWWLVTAIHETGHHVERALGVPVSGALSAAAKAGGAESAEQGQWSDWSAELFADAFASAFAGGAAAWAVTELEQGCADPFAGRLTYPPAEVRLRIMAALVAATGGPDPRCTLTGGAPPPNPKARGLLDRVPAIVTALLDVPVAATTLRALAGDGLELAQAQARWAAGLRAGTARPSKTLEAAAWCVGGAVRAWRDGDRPDPATLSKRVLDVLPLCRPDGIRAAGGPDEGAEAAQALIDTLFDPGAPL